MVVSLDEVGRGCLAGPVVVAAVILPKDFESPIVKDSKKLSEKKRKEAFSILSYIT
jgi:ribonuclease HII